MFSFLTHRFSHPRNVLPPVCCHWLPTAIYNHQEAWALYATCHRDLARKLVMCKSPHCSPYSYPNPVPKRWASIAGTFLKLTCDPCKQVERVCFPTVGLLSLSLLFPLFLYLQRNSNTKNSLSRGHAWSFLNLHRPPTCNSLWPWAKAQIWTLPLFWDTATEFVWLSHWTPWSLAWETKLWKEFQIK